MRRKWAWWGAIAAAALATWFVGWFPYYRLDREVAAARSEGLWTELSDIPKGIQRAAPAGENAAPIVRTAIAMGKTGDFAQRNVSEAMGKLLKGKASAEEKAKVRLALLSNPKLLTAWREASECPRLDFGRDWSKGYAVLFPESPGVKQAAKLLAAAAALGLEPKENLSAAARLSVLVRQEPDLIAQLVSVSMGATTLREAKKEGLSSAVEPALGPPLDARWAHAGELALALDTMRRIGSPEWFHEMGANDTRSFFERMRNTGPWKANAALRLVQDYRALWKELPKEPSNYGATISAVEHWQPKIDEELGDSSSLMRSLIESDPKTVANWVRAFRKFESERKAVRAP